MTDFVDSVAYDNVKRINVGVSEIIKQLGKNLYQKL